MAVQQKEVSFIGWLEDLIKLPKSVPEQTIAVVKDQYNNYLVLNTRVFATTGATTEADVIQSYIEGPESVADIKGVATQINLTDLVTKGPYATLRTLGIKTWSQISDLDEVSQDRRGYYVDLLTKGETIDKYGRALEDPRNLLLGFSPRKMFPFGKGFPVETTAAGTRASQIQLLKEEAPGSGEYEDRMVVEELPFTAPSNRRKARTSQYKTYLSLANSLHRLSSEMESTGARNLYHTSTVIDFNRTIAKELGINLDEVLPTQLPSQAKSMGTLHQTVASFTRNPALAGGKIDQILQDPNRICQALNINIAQYNAFTPETQKWLKNWLALEELNIRNSYIVPWRQTPQALINTWANNGLDSYITGTDYTSSRGILGAVREGFVTGDLAHERKKYALEGSLMFDAWSAQIKRDIVNGKTTSQQGNMALRRLRAAQKSLEISNGLFFASTVKDIFEAVDQGSFLKQVFVATRLLGALPFVSKRIRSGSDFAKWLAPENLPIVRDVTKLIEDGIKATGINFEAHPTKLKGLQKIKGGWKDSRVSIEWQIRDATGNPTGNWGIKMVKAKDAQGIFNNAVPISGRTQNFGIFDILRNIEKHDLKTRVLELLPSTITPTFNSLTSPQAFLTDLANGGTNLETFLDKLLAAGKGTLSSTDPEFIQFNILANTLGLFDPQNCSEFEYNLNLFKTHGKHFLTTIFDNLGISRDTRWDVLMTIYRQGKIKQFKNIYAGILNTYNRYANHLRNYFYKNVLFGSVITDLPVIGRLYSPIQGFLRNLGMSDEISLAGAIKQWRVIKRIEIFGRLLQKASMQTGTALSAPLNKALIKIAGRKITNFIARKLVGKALGQLVLKTVGILLSLTSSVVTGGLSWVLTAIGDIALKFTKNILTLKFGKAFKEAGHALKGKLVTVKKVVIYPLTCIIGCISLPFIFIILVGSTLVALDPFGGGSFTESTVSKKISVEKAATLKTRQNKIEYTITLKNISDEEVSISSFKESLSYIPDCENNASTAIQYDTPEFPGTLDTALDEISNQFVGQKLGPGADITVSFTLKDIDDNKNATYFNSVEVTAENDSEKKGLASSSIDIGDGGCVTCPQGWPVKPFFVTQGPWGASRAQNTHAKFKSEAIDLAAVTGTQIKATHSGTAHIGDDPDGYGNFVWIKSPKGFVSIYAHMSEVLIQNDTPVNQGSIIGKVGSTGNSEGPHLHYEFVKPLKECYPDELLRMEQIENPLYSEDSYIPHSIKRDCVGRNACNYSVQ